MELRPLAALLYAVARKAPSEISLASYPQSDPQSSELHHLESLVPQPLGPTPLKPHLDPLELPHFESLELQHLE